MPAKWLVEIEIADDFIIDGFRELDPSDLAESISEKFLAGCAKQNEVKCRIIKSPSVSELDRIENDFAEAELEYQAHYCG